MDPSRGRTTKDTNARAKRRERVKAAIIVPESEVGAFPGLGGRGRLPVAMKLRAGGIHAIGEKLTRVALYARYRQYVPATRTVATHIVDRGSHEQQIYEMIRLGERVDVPPGVFVAIRPAQDDLDTVMAVVDLWGHVRVFTSVTPPDERRTND
jgi:hypothetical protein